MRNTMSIFQRIDNEARTHLQPRKDIRERSDRELVLLVANSISLYAYRNHPVIWDIINNQYLYTAKQLSELETYLSDEV